MLIHMAFLYSLLCTSGDIFHYTSVLVIKPKEVEQRYYKRVDFLFVLGKIRLLI